MLKTILGALASAILAASAYAQTYPSQPIKFIVPYTQGTGMDTIARVTGAKLHVEAWAKAALVADQHNPLYSL